MPCPFGFTANDADDEGDVSSEGEESQDKEERTKGSEDESERPRPASALKKDTSANGVSEKKPKKKVKIEDMTFDFDKDPVSWFYQNQIKSEAEFAKKKEVLRAEARKRLDQIMSKKSKAVEWPSDSDLDELSIRSSELSELDSDVDSLGSIVSCANSWIEDARYGTPAEKTMTTVAYLALIAIAFSLYLAMQAVTSTRKVMGVLSNGLWPNAAFLSGALLGGTFIGVLLAARYRTRRILLISQVAMLVLYSAFLVILCGVVLQPTSVDPKLRDVACVKYSKSDQGSRLCKMLPAIESELAEQMSNLAWAGGLAATCALAVLSTSLWYLHELAYIEKKAIKHKRRHKRRKHSIPWDKIKIVGPVTKCGAGGGAAPGGGGGGKCPIAHGGGAAPAASKCPVAGIGAKPAAAKKNE
ncbi:hypothetical protein PLESTB_000871300 [Pleodorina starrii]|uniref:Transmembrane protein n=1 Tax=Pleodorina starrii TaxID=330485 RepID=A0A9W6F363_9CHLO|nr:hypothetical protein PLESTM_002030100 [Pleodorina starrii]GLC54479.1 hypothetical protein PLESTB_000871300 [Pleodorina starrii]GLC76144.1 hypothetical protein PLESTF_001739600 [Pleodorina starrii]